MRILYNHRTRATGADGNHIRHVAEAFKRLGHEVDIVSPAGVSLYAEKTNAKPGRRKRLVENLRFAMPQVVFEFLEISYNLPHYLRVVRELKNKKYDLIYERYAIYNITGILAARKFNIPIVLESSFTSKTYVIPERSRLLRPLAMRLDRFIFKKADAVVAVTEYLKKEIEGFSAAADKIIVLPNAADIDKFHPGRSGAGIRRRYNLEGKKVIGFTGGFYPWHGIDLLIKAGAKICSKDKGVAVLIVGDGLLRPQMEKMAEDLGVKDSIIFTGRVAHNEVPDYVAAFDVGIMPDSNIYGSPMKILEYMASAKPVVAPRLKPIEVLMDNGVEGILIEPKSIDEMADALIKILNNPDLGRKMGKAGRDKVAEKHCWVENVKRFFRFFENLEHKHGRSK